MGICWHAGTPQSLSDLAIDLITHGYANPAFFGDETIQRGLAQYGVPPEEACNYVNSTCVEITPVRRQQCLGGFALLFHLPDPAG